MFDEVQSEVEEIASSLGDSVDFYTQEDIARNLREIALSGRQSTNDASVFGVANSSVIDKDESKDADDLLLNALNAYNEKYNLHLTPQTLTENLKIASFLGKQEKDINDLVQRGILGNAADHLYFKTLISLYKLIDKSVQNIFNSDYANNFSMETIAVINQMFQWLSQLESLKQKYQMYDFDKTMNKLISSTSDELDTTQKSPVPALMQRLIKLGKKSNDETA
jgi:hypothetical protein